MDRCGVNQYPVTPKPAGGGHPLAGDLRLPVILSYFIHTPAITALDNLWMEPTVAVPPTRVPAEAEEYFDVLDEQGTN